MKRVFFACAFALAALSFASCEKDDPVADSGLNSKSCEATTPVIQAGESFPVTFDAKGAWTIEPSRSWITVTPTSGAAGQNEVAVVVEANNTSGLRSGLIEITVEGFAKETLTQIRQTGQGGGGDTKTLNDWIDETMCTMYLWNKEWDTLNMMERFAEQDPQTFLQSGIELVDAEFDHINIEDGGWGRDGDDNITVGQGREYFSVLEISNSAGVASAPATRQDLPSGLDASNFSGFGFHGLYPMALDATSNAKIGIAVMAVFPDSPAAKAGIHRGSYITRINGNELTKMSYNTLLSALSYTSGSVEVATRDIRVDPATGIAQADENGLPIFEEETTYTLTAASYPNNPIFFSDVLSYEVGGKTVKIGYLSYWQFIMAYDDQLIEAFREFKNEGIDELVIDLRYNGGGVVMSSTMLATLIAGPDYRDQIFSQSKYNASRLETDPTLEQRGIYRIGNSQVPDLAEGYPQIEQALEASVNLDRVYVVGGYDTASASEMLVNGLRGLGIDVRLVGQRTHGKNVGMEVLSATSGTTSYIFRPVTFRSTNCNNEGDYADGFVPDVRTALETEYAIFDFGNRNEVAFQWILEWIVSDNKPTPTLAPATRSSMKVGEPVILHPSQVGALTFRPDLSAELE